MPAASCSIGLAIRQATTAPMLARTAVTIAARLAINPVEAPINCSTDTRRRRARLARRVTVVNSTAAPPARTSAMRPAVLSTCPEVTSWRTATLPPNPEIVELLLVAFTCSAVSPTTT